MQNILKILFINKLYLLGLVFFFSGTMAFAQEGALSKTYVDSLKKSEEKLWYVDKFKSEQKPIDNQKESERLIKILAAIASVFRALVWVILGAGVLGAIYVIFKNLKGFRFRSNPEVAVITTEAKAEELDIKAFSTLDLSSLIEKSIQEKNYRLAVRYYYLWAMKMLNEAQLIEFNIDKTNQDYTQELSKRNNFSRDRLSLFIQCTHYYEYLWFGNFAVTETAFLTIEKTFKDFLKK
ncbi:hypothetical protein [Emticicia soli]|uniref:DUF4129 domain-containing protein n=1 Tax=Emticicia soli TaxID=2027878 RepID=A0ABW5JEZ3_9BACT